MEYLRKSFENTRPKKSYFELDEKEKLFFFLRTITHPYYYKWLFFDYQIEVFMDFYNSLKYKE
jgi:hypothetical protein